MSRLRQHKTGAAGPGKSEGRTTHAATPSRRLAASLAFAVVVFAAAQLASYGPKTTPVPAFVNHALGAPQPQAPSTRRPAPDISITIHPHGFTYDAGAGGALTLTAAATRFASGSLARTDGGTQAITINKPKGAVEAFATAGRRLGFHIQRWRLGTWMALRVGVTSGA